MAEWINEVCGHPLVVLFVFPIVFVILPLALLGVLPHQQGLDNG